MDIDSKYFEVTCAGPEFELVKKDILSAGPFYTGSIATGMDKQQYQLFSHVNKESMQYILDAIDATKEVKIEILAHDGNTKPLQSQDYWKKFNI